MKKTNCVETSQVSIVSFARWKRSILRHADLYLTNPSDLGGFSFWILVERGTFAFSAAWVSHLSCYPRLSTQNARFLSKAWSIQNSWFLRSHMFEETHQLAARFPRWVPCGSPAFLLFILSVHFRRYFCLYSKVFCSIGPRVGAEGAFFSRA